LYLILCVFLNSVAVLTLFKRVRQHNIQIRFAVDRDAWPPNQPNDFTPLLLIRHSSQHNFKQAAALQLAESVALGGVNIKHYPRDSRQPLREALDNSKTTKQLVDILAPLQESDDPHFILIEGLPGIGKSLLLQEIAYNWAKRNLLQKFKIVLLVQLRNPALQEISVVADFFRLICQGDERASDIAAASSEYFFENEGKGLVFLFDGFDEYPNCDLQTGLINSILERKVLPHCGLVVSSRPHASVSLRQQATVRVDILGFDDDERKLYIEQSLKGEPHAVKELTEYLEGNLTVNGLCFIPFNMVVLIYLYKQGISLPSNPTQLYNYFIYLTICRHFAKCRSSLENSIPDLSNLPEPCKTIVNQLSQLAFKGINANKLIFTLQEMRTVCPNIAAVAGAINGFGLLQAVQHFGLTGKLITFNFVHYSIQEFLAAYHITQLSLDTELSVLNGKFWNDIFSNMFLMYISLTKGRRLAFKQFLSGGTKGIIIAATFLKDQLKCLRLFRSFYEAGDKVYYTYVQDRICNAQLINLSGLMLSTYDVECLGYFLNHSSHKDWNKLELKHCSIQDHDLRVLYHELSRSDITIRMLDMSNNGLTRLSSSSISKLTSHCRVEVLVIDGNDIIGENPTLYKVLFYPFSRLTRLDMYDTKLSSVAAIMLFSGLAHGSKLQLLNIMRNAITDEACNAICKALNKNTSLVKLWMYDNRISSDAAHCIVGALYHNQVLQVLCLPHFPDDVRIKIKSQENIINQKRENGGCQIKLQVDCS